MRIHVKRWLVGAIVAATALYAACDSSYRTVDANAGEGGVGDSSATDATGLANDGAKLDAASTLDAGDGAPAMCDVALPFGMPTPITTLNAFASASGDTRLTPDGLTAFFSAQIDGGAPHLYTSTRAALASSFGSLTALMALNSTGAVQVYPTVSGDGLTIYFESFAPPGGLGAGDVVFATRASSMAAFGTPNEVSGINTAGDDTSPFILEDGTTLYWASTTAVSTTTYDLFYATRGSGGAFGKPAALTELNTSSDELAPAVTPDGLVIYFSSDRAAKNAVGANDIWVATRASTSAPFTSLTNVAELNTAGNDLPSFITADRCTIYLTSSISGADEIYVATKSP